MAERVEVSWVLQVWWIAGILPILTASIPSSRITSLHQLILSLARRGKTMPTSSISKHSHSQHQKFTVPQKFFLHFYIFAVVWTTTLLVFTWRYANKVGGSDSTFAGQRYYVWRSVFFLLLLEVQVSRRLYETLFVFKYRQSARMHTLGYLVGYYFYIAAPLSLCHGCVVDVFNFAADQLAVVNEQGMSVIAYGIWGYLKPFTLLGWCEWVGALIFLWGWIHQCKCHAILGSLRRKKKDEEKHVIPTGDWFEYVSCPHYFAEMVIYTGLIVASGGTDLAVWLVFAFTAANLIFAAGDCHRWYLQKFEDYPQNRKAVIPLLY